MINLNSLTLEMYILNFKSCLYVDYDQRYIIFKDLLHFGGHLEFYGACTSFHHHNITFPHPEDLENIKKHAIALGNSQN